MKIADSSFAMSYTFPLEVRTFLRSPSTSIHDFKNLKALGWS